METKTGTAWGDYIVGGMTGVRQATSNVHQTELKETNEEALLALNNFIEGFYTGNWSTTEQETFITDKKGYAAPGVYGEGGEINQENLDGLLSISEQFVAKLDEDNFRW